MAFDCSRNNRQLIRIGRRGEDSLLRQQAAAAMTEKLLSNLRLVGGLFYILFHDSFLQVV